MRKEFEEFGGRRFGMKNLILVLLAIAVLVMLLVMVIPKVTTSYVQKGFQQGFQTCMTQTTMKVVQDLNTLGYTTLTIGNQTVLLGVMQPPQAQR